MLVLVTRSVPGNVTHLVLSPAANELVCVWRNHPALVGHDRFNTLPDTLNWIFPGSGFAGVTARIWSEPLRASLLVQLYVPPTELVAGSLIVVNSPLTAGGNNWNESPACKICPILVTVSVPPPVIVPRMEFNLSLVCALMRLSSSSRLPPRIMSLVTVSVPMDEPGNRIEPAAVVSLPLMLPLPIKVWPLFNVKGSSIR